MSELVIGVDLGGTQIRAVLADEAGAILKRHSGPTLAQEGPEAVLERIYLAIQKVMPEDGVAAIAAGVPGPTDPYLGIILMGPNLPGWRNVRLRELIYDRFRAPVFVGNDANLAGLAEHRFGAGRGVKHMIYMTVSTGIGTGVIVDNQMLLGRQGLAAEIGHMTIDVSVEDANTFSLPPHERVLGTLEGLSSGPNLAKRARQALTAGASSAVLGDVDESTGELTPRMLNEAAQRGDQFALDQFHAVARYLGIGITNMLHIFNPERIVVGGSVWMHAQDLMLGPIWATIRSRAQSPEYWQKLSIVTAELGDDVGLLGAVALAHDGLSGRRVA